jgi:hypothetical protein
MDAATATCRCTSPSCQDYRRAVLEKAADQIAERPAAITNRCEAAQFLAWFAGQIVASLELADKAEED